MPAHYLCNAANPNEAPLRREFLYASGMPRPLRMSAPPHDDATDETHACRNLSGAWRPALPALAARYESTGMVEGAVYDAAAGGFASLRRVDKPSQWVWERNTSRPSLLVFQEDYPEDVPVGAQVRTRMPTADAMDWPSALLGRVVIFVGDSLGHHQATNLLMLITDRDSSSIEHARRPFAPGSGESIHQTSWCRAVCAKVHELPPNPEMLTPP